MKEKYSVKLERVLSFIFKIILLLYLYFQSMVIFHNTVFIGIALWGLLLVGAVVCILRVFLYKSFVKTGGIILLGLFLLSYAIAIFTNMEYGFNADIANWVILALTFAVIYLQELRPEDHSGRYRRRCQYQPQRSRTVFPILPGMFSSRGSHSAPPSNGPVFAAGNHMDSAGDQFCLWVSFCKLL